jgi:hypothetical protein
MTEIAQGEEEMRNEFISNYINIDRIIQARINQFKVRQLEPLITDPLSSEHRLIYSNMGLIENLYSLIFSHPCFSRDILEKYEGIREYIDGIAPMYKETQYDRYLLVVFFKLSIVYDFQEHNSSISKLYHENDSITGQIIKHFFIDVLYLFSTLEETPFLILYKRAFFKQSILSTPKKTSAQKRLSALCLSYFSKRLASST